MHLLPCLPTIEHILGELSDWVRFSPSFVQTLDIPKPQMDFLVWIGLPKKNYPYTLNLNGQSEVWFCIEEGQQRFAELYPIFQNSEETIYLERFTGFLWQINTWILEYKKSPGFVASGIEEFFLLHIVDSGEYGHDFYYDSKEEARFMEDYGAFLEEEKEINPINDGTYLTFNEADLLSGMIDSRFRQSTYFNEELSRYRTFFEITRLLINNAI
jgi:hypothetical protein